MNTKTEHLLFDNSGFHLVSSPILLSDYVYFKNGIILPTTNFIFEKYVDSNGGFSFVKIESDASQINLRLIDSDLPEILSYILIIVYDTTNDMYLSKALSILITTNPLGYNLSYGHPMYEYKIKHFLSSLIYSLSTTELWNPSPLQITGAVIEQNNGSHICCHIFNPVKFIDYLLDHIIVVGTDVNPSIECNTQLTLALAFIFH